ncbi:hypothetical protein IQ270_25335 [Microcoleus sp. LEGE 07076]|uniref:hypothetical protein n=1 Tax=Microcoleus sp. LEGE 07076 TaxID=915322 RepID=UPI0019EE7A2E|nr:hypothetical protein [Microcoleus sp. LEGE 07076]
MTSGVSRSSQDLCKNASQIIDSIARCRRSLGQVSPADGIGAFVNPLSGKNIDRTFGALHPAFDPSFRIKYLQSVQKVDRPFAVESQNLAAAVNFPDLAKLSICIPHL